MNPYKYLCQTTTKQLRPLSVTLDDIQPEDVIFYSRLLGIDLYRERHLLWIAVTGLLSGLPKPWIACEDRRRRVYYYNTVNNYSTWINPNDIELQGLVNRIRCIDTMNSRLNRSSLLQDLIPEEVEEESVSEIDFKDDSTASNSIESIDQVNLKGNQQSNAQESLMPEKANTTNEDNLNEQKITNVNATLSDEYEDDFEQVSIEEAEKLLEQQQPKNEEYLERIQVQVKNCETNLTQAMRQMGRELERTIQVQNQTAPSDATQIDLHKEIESLSTAVKTIHANLAENQALNRAESLRQTNDAFGRIDSVLDRNVNVTQSVLQTVQTLAESVANQGKHFYAMEQNFSAFKIANTPNNGAMEAQLQHLNKQIDHLLKNNQELLRTVQSKSTSSESIGLESNLSEFQSKFVVLERKVDSVLNTLTEVKSSSTNHNNSTIVKLVQCSEQTQTDNVQQNIPLSSNVSVTLRRCIRELNTALTDDIQMDKHTSRASPTTTTSSSSSSSQLIQHPKHIRSKSLSERRKRQHPKRYENSRIEDKMDKIHERSYSLVSLIHQTNRQLSRELENIRSLKKFEIIATPRAPSTEHKHKPDSVVILQNLKQLRSKVNDRIDRLSQAIERQKITNV